MISPRWLKVIRDLWFNRKRILISVLSIAVGIFAVGTTSHMYMIVTRDLAGSFASANPADVVVQTSDLFDQDLVDAIARMPEVKSVQGWRSLSYQFRTPGDDQWYSINLSVPSDYNNLVVNKVYPEKQFGPDPVNWPNPEVWPPIDREIVMERTSLLTANLGLAGKAKQGDSIIIRLPGKREKEMPIVGLAYDPGRAPAPFVNSVTGFITEETAVWLGEQKGFNELRVVTHANPPTLENTSKIGNKIKDRMERGGHNVFLMVASQPGKHPVGNIVEPLILLMGAMGLLSLPLSGFLVINTVSAFIAQQIRQIGVMKAIGANTFQIASLYLVMVMSFGLLALVIAGPLAAYAAYRLVNFMAYFVNFNLSDFYIPKEVIIIELAIGLLVPVLAALHPVLKGARITVREAISNYGMGQGFHKYGLLDRLIERLQSFPRPLMLSLRNTFRRKARVALTVSTLVLASAIFIAVFSLQASLNRTLDELIDFLGFDVQLQFTQSYRVERLQETLINVPGIEAMEGWGLLGITRIRPDGSETSDIMVMEAMPPDSKMMNPKVRAGRWLLPTDENAVVVSPSVLDKEKDLVVGGPIRLKVKGHESDWTIAGVANMMDSGQMIIYTSYAYFARVTEQHGKTNFLMLSTLQHDGDSQLAVMKAVTDNFNDQGIKVSQAVTLGQARTQNELLFGILTGLLMAMAVLLAIVGGLGLMGLMSINVIERTREIGVMRAIGASNGSILSIFMVEGILIGFISWLIGVFAAYPISYLLSEAIGRGMLSAPLSFSFSVSGAIIWLALSLLLAGIATFFPARDAARMTVRDVLAYE